MGLKTSCEACSRPLRAEISWQAILNHNPGGSGVTENAQPTAPSQRRRSRSSMIRFSFTILQRQRADRPAGAVLHANCLKNWQKRSENVKSLPQCLKVERTSKERASNVQHIATARHGVICATLYLRFLTLIVANDQNRNPYTLPPFFAA